MGGSGRLSKSDVAVMREQVVRMLRLSHADNTIACRFAAKSRDLAARGPVGRLFRSPCLFEDVVKTFTLCNCGWTRTITMNDALCNEIGAGAFPSALELAKVSPKRLRARCGVGYRAERIVRLAKAVVSGQLDLQKMESAGSAEAYQHCLSIYGLGPFGAANIMQLQGHYEHIPADSETARHLRQAHGLRSCTLVNVGELAARVYASHAPMQFLRYWTELWQTYEDRMGGRASDVDPAQYRLTTAAYMKVKRQPYASAKRQRSSRPKRPAASAVRETAKRLRLSSRG